LPQRLTIWRRSRMCWKRWHDQAFAPAKNFFER
jgi:hypothetical protein